MTTLDLIRNEVFSGRFQNWQEDSYELECSPAFYDLVQQDIKKLVKTTQVFILDDPDMNNVKFTKLAIPGAGTFNFTTTPDKMGFTIKSLTAKNGSTEHY